MHYSAVFTSSASNMAAHPGYCPRRDVGENPLYGILMVCACILCQPRLSAAGIFKGDAPNRVAGRFYFIHLTCKKVKQKTT